MAKVNLKIAELHNPETYFQDGKNPISLYPHVLKFFSDLGVNVIADAAFYKRTGA